MERIFNKQPSPRISFYYYVVKAVGNGEAPLQCDFFLVGLDTERGVVARSAGDGTADRSADGSAYSPTFGGAELVHTAS